MHKAILIGLGYWGINYVNTINALANIELVGAVDFDPDRTDDLKKRIPSIVVGTDLRSVARDSGATLAIVATPAQTHYAVAKLAMQLGLHVLVEKPLTLSSGESQDLLLQAEKSSITLHTGLNYMTHPCVQAVEELVDRGLEINHIQSERYNLGPTRSDVGVIEDLVPHDISIACTIFRSTPLSIRALGLSKAKATGYASVEVVFESGASLIANLSWRHPQKVRSVVFSGPKSLVTFNELAAPGRELFIQNFETVKLSTQLSSLLVSHSQFLDFKAHCIRPDIFDMRSQPLTVSLQKFLDDIEAGICVTYSAKIGHEVTKAIETLNQI